MRGKAFRLLPRAALAGILLALAAGFPGTLAQEIPPRPDRSVNDLAGVLRAEDRQALEALNREVLEKSGAAIVVLTLPDLGGYPIEGYANRLGREWGIGSRETDRGILFLVSVGDRKVRIETGYGVEGYLPDGITGEILDEEVVPHFRNGDLSAGIVAGDRKLAALTAREFGFELSEPASSPAEAGRSGRGRGARGILGGLFGLLLLFLFLSFAVRHPLLALLLFSGMGRGRGGSHGRGFGAGGFGGGGFGGFGGGSFGGGGATRGW